MGGILAKRVNIKKSPQNKSLRVELPNYTFLMSFPHPQKKNRETFRKQLPTKDVSAENIGNLCRLKQMLWRPFLYKYRIGGLAGFDVLDIQPYPIMVLDVDGVPLDEMAGILLADSKWRYSNDLQFSLSPSISGRGSHLHIWIDLSQYSGSDLKDPTLAKTGYKFSERADAYRAIWKQLADSLKDDCGLIVDENAMWNGITYLEAEIKNINSFWIDKEPQYIAANIVKLDEERLVRSQVFLNTFFAELERFVNDPKAASIVYSWTLKYDDHGAKNLPFFYQEAISKIKRNLLTVKANLLRSFVKYNWLKNRNLQTIYIGKTVPATEFFGLTTTRATYLRRTFLFILSLQKTDLHTIKKKRDGFSLVEAGYIDRPYFATSFLKKHWYNEMVVIEPPSEIARRLGEGNTWNELRKLAPQYCQAVGPEQTFEVLASALSQSKANDKERRIKDLQRFLASVSIQKSALKQRNTVSGQKNFRYSKIRTVERSYKGLPVKIVVKALLILSVSNAAFGSEKIQTRKEPSAPVVVCTETHEGKVSKNDDLNKKPGKVVCVQPKYKSVPQSPKVNKGQ